MKKTFVLICLTLLFFCSCSNKQNKKDVLSGKQFINQNQWGETEFFTFSDKGEASFVVETKSLDKKYRMETFYQYNINQEDETLNLKITKYPFLTDDDEYISLDYDKLIELDYEGKEAYDDVFGQTISYKYVLLPTKLILTGTYKNQEFELVK